MRAVVIGAGIAALGVFYYLTNPEQGYMPECPFYHFTHLYCPGCGTQRGIHALLHGNFSGAMSYNPLMVLSLIFMIAESALWLAKQRLVHVRTLSSYRYTPWVVFSIVMIYWVLRNIPFVPFTLLAPQ